jgi:hypothetical protein
VRPTLFVEELKDDSEDLHPRSTGFKTPASSGSGAKTPGGLKLLALRPPLSKTPVGQAPDSGSVDLRGRRAGQQRRGTLDLADPTDGAQRAPTLGVLHRVAAELAEPSGAPQPPGRHARFKDDGDGNSALPNPHKAAAAAASGSAQTPTARGASMPTGGAKTPGRIARLPGSMERS